MHAYLVLLAVYLIIIAIMLVAFTMQSYTSKKHSIELHNGVWKKDRLPIPVYVCTSVPKRYYNALFQAGLYLESIVDVTLFHVVLLHEEDRLNAFDRAEPPLYAILVRMQDCDDSVTITRITKSTNEITGARIQLPCGFEGREFDVILHELCHCLGLRHCERRGDIMNASLKDDCEQRVSDEDIEYLQSVYRKTT